jgi:DNA-binding NarL/FixJ family response regulator
VARSVFDVLKERGEEVMNQISGELMQNPAFIKAMQGAIKGKEKIEEAATQALRGMNIPTRTEFKKALSKIEALERELAVQRAAVEGLAVKAEATRPKATPPKAASRKRAAKAKPKVKAAKVKTGA